MIHSDRKLNCRRYFSRPTMFSLVSVVCKMLVCFSVKPHYCNKTLDTAYITWIRAIQLTYLKNEWTSSNLRGSSICSNTVIYFLTDLESKWQAGLAKCTVFWYKQTQCMPLRTTKNIVCSWILESSRSGKHPEGHIRQGLGLRMLCEGTIRSGNATHQVRSFVPFPPKCKFFLPSSSALSCQFAEAPAGVRILLIYQKFLPKTQLWFGWE